MNTTFTKTIFAVAALQSTSEAMRLQHLVNQSHQLAQTQGIFDDIWKGVTDAANTVADGVVDAANEVNDWGDQAGKDIATGFNDAGNAIGTGFNDAGNAITGAANDVYDWGEGAVDTLGNLKVQSPIYLAQARSQGIFDDIWKGVTDAANTVADGVVDAANEVNDWGDQAGKDIATGFNDAGNAIVTGFDDAGNAIYGFGEDAVDTLGNLKVRSPIYLAQARSQGIFDDIASGFTDATNAVGGAFEDAGNAIADGAEDVYHGIDDFVSNDPLNTITQGTEDAVAWTEQQLQDAANEILKNADKVAKDFEKAFGGHWLLLPNFP